MPNLSVKDVPDAWAAALRERATRNHRSLQGELMAILEAAIQQPADPSGVPQTRGGLPARGRVVNIDRYGHPVIRQGWKSIDQIAAELRMRSPEPVTGAPLGVDIIRADRDSR